MESQDVTVDVPTNEEATQSSENQPKSEPSKGMLKSSSTAARFQVAPVSAGNETKACLQFSLSLCVRVTCIHGWELIGLRTSFQERYDERKFTPIIMPVHREAYTNWTVDTEKGLFLSAVNYDTIMGHPKKVFRHWELLESWHFLHWSKAQSMIAYSAKKIDSLCSDFSGKKTNKKFEYDLENF